LLIVVSFLFKRRGFARVRIVVFRWSLEYTPPAGLAQFTLSVH
jgi:hypothetical protein